MSLSIRLAPTVDSATLAMLARAVPFDVDGGGDGDVRDIAPEGSAIFQVLEGEQLVGAFALEVQSFKDGHLVRCLSAAGTGASESITPAICAFVEREARERIGARAITSITPRRGMVRRMQRLGFRVAGYVMRKDL